MRSLNFENRFGGTSRLYSQQGTAKLSRSHVAVIGIGGVGSWAAEALARTALGKITLIDLDDICVTNTNRQIHALSNTIGQEKVDAMAQRIALINPDCQVECIEDFIAPDNVTEYLQDFDYVIEATDSVKAKAAIIAHCKRRKIPVITVGGAGGQIDPQQIKITDLAKTIQDPLAAKVRNLLRREYNFSKNPKRRFAVPCVYSTEQLRYPTGEGDTCYQKQFNDGSTKLDCNTGFGAAVTVTASFGMFAASHVINKLSQA